MKTRSFTATIATLLFLAGGIFGGSSILETPLASVAQAASAPFARSFFLPSRHLQQGPGGFYFEPSGLGEDYPPDSTPLARIDEDLALMRATGTRFLRVGFSWHSIEPEKGKYNWALWDHLVDLTSRSGITLL